METLQITLFGHVSVVHPHANEPLKLPRSAQALLAYLLLHQHLAPRDVLMDVFWVNHPPDRARSSLTTALWRLRHLLEPDDVTPGTYLVTGSMGEVGFNWASNHFLDTKFFEQHICPLLRRPMAELCDHEIEQIEQVLTLYRGELLEGIYDDWALRERERFRSLHLNCLTRLMEFYAGRKEFERGIALACEILRRDPMREEIHRALMRLYLDSGQRTLALGQYIQCRDLLSQELGVLPLPETVALYQQVLASSEADVQRIAGQSNGPEIAQLLDELHLVRHSLIEAARALERINQTVSSLMNGGQAPPGCAGRRGR